MRWAIWGTGAISARFVGGLADVPGARASMVASRDGARAAAFAQRHGISGHVGGDDPAAVAAALAAVADIAYIATPTGWHAAHADACLAAGLHVLVEKPLASTAAEAEQLAEAARRHGRFLMEGLWTRMLPAARALADAAAALGDIRLITGGFAVVNRIDPALPRFHAAAGGGALRLYGIYPLAMGQMLAGRATGITAAGHRSGDLDTRTAMTVSYASGAIGQYHCALDSSGDNPLVVHCTGGHAALIGPIFRPTGKHVYCEKPLTSDLAVSESLFELAAAQGRMLMAAPCNMFSDSVQTLWRALASGAVGRPLLSYAEVDDNPIYLMHPEGWRSRSGAPWPYLHEYEAGCTWEHVGYHLAWMCALFGPVRSVTAFSRVTVPHKTDKPLHPADTPDFSVAVLDFESGVFGRITCSIAVPLDHRMRVIGDEGEMTVSSYNAYRAAVWLERFSTLTLNARKSLSVRRHALLAGIFGVGGKPLKLLKFPWSAAVMQPSAKRRPSLPKRLVAAVKRRELGIQDKMLGPVLMARAIAAGASAPLPPAFILHLNELTLAIQAAGTTSAPYVPRHRFAPLQPLGDAINQPADWRVTRAPGFLDRLLGPRLDALHQH
jgi:predicted dehydrogenase